MQFSEINPKTKRKKTPTRSSTHTASFRDPSGSLFFENGQLLRNVNVSYKENYDFLIKSGLYKELKEKKFLIPHKILKNSGKAKHIYKVIKPDLIPFISYPYEWCFGQLKDAALLTLVINKISLKRGMILKDASAYNIQFMEGKPIFIDTLSFDKYKEGIPWIAYQQFCRHFLSPLLLASYKDTRLMQLSKINMDGIPLDLTSKLLPSSSLFKFSVLTNIHLQAKAEKALENKFIKRKTGRVSKNSLLAILDNLDSLITGLKLNIKKSEWQNYYQDNSYKDSSLREKKRMVKSFINEVGSIKSLWDLGANTGFFSKKMVSEKTLVINFDNDFLAIEKNYEDVKKRKLINVLPLLMDLTNPSSGIGWMNRERDSLIERGPCDLAMALALVHHLAISNNLPFSHIANFFSRICRWLIIEFVPKDDLQIKKMLLNRDDMFENYNMKNFEKEFSEYFIINQRVNIRNSERILYLMKKK